MFDRIERGAGHARHLDRRGEGTDIRPTIAAILVACSLAAPAAAPGAGGPRLLIGRDSHFDGGRVDAPPDAAGGRVMTGLSGSGQAAGSSGALIGPPDGRPPKPEPPPRRAPLELTGNDEGVFAFQELDPAAFADYLATCDGATLEERKAWHVGFTLSAWVMVGTDAEFDAAARDAARGPDAIAANNRLVVAFEQFAPDGRRQPGRRAKFGFEVDLFGNVYPCVAPGDGGPEMARGGVETENQAAPAFPEIASCSVVLVNPLRRMCANPRYKFEYRTGAKETGTGAGAPTARLLMRWKRMFIHFYPEVGGNGLATTPPGDPAGEPRYAVSIYPARPADPSAPRLAHFVDGVMLSLSRFPTPWTASTNFHFGATTDLTGGYVIDTSLLSINSEIPLEVR